MTFEYVDDLPPRGRGAKWHLLEQFPEDLRANAGRWAKWPTRINELSAKQYANTINGNRHPRFPDEFEAAVRDGTLYVRYVPAAGWSA